MQTIEQLRDKIESAEGLHKVVSTMKALAAVNIRQYQRANESLAAFAQTVEQGLHVLLSTTRDRLRLREDMQASAPAVLAVAFGSDQGMVGQFNSRMLRYARRQLRETGADASSRRVLAVGRRLAAGLRSEGENVVDAFDLPRDADTIVLQSRRLLPVLQRLRDRGVGRVLLMHHVPKGGASYEPALRHVFPLDMAWLRALRNRPWPGPALPTFRAEPEVMLAHLIGQHLFVSLFRAFAASMAAENASRLSSMQAAERNIEDRLDGLRQRYHRRRQGQITSELLDVMAGFEAARND